MATRIQFRRGTTSQHSSFTGAEGEVTVDTTKDTLVVHDGSTVGGFALAKESAIANFIDLTDISVTDSGGDGSLTYNNTTGVITYTGPSASEVRAHFSASTGISITNGAISSTITQYTDALARAAISVTDSGGDGSLSYNSSTGVLTFTGPSATDVRAHFSAGTGVTITNGQVAIGQAVGTTSNVTFNDLTVSGNLTVSGTTTTVNTETINLADNIITLNSNETSTPSQNAGIEVERGSSTNVVFQWNETTDVWEYTVDGTNYIPIVGTTATQTLTNKTISGSSNTLSNIANASLTNSSITVNGSAISLGGSATIKASTTNALTIGTGLSGTSFDGGSAVTIAIDSSVVTLTGSQTLTNKTLTLPTIGATGATFNGSTSGTTVVVASATAGTTTLTLPAATDTLVGKATTDTLTNKTISGSSNTLSNIANASLTNSAITLAGTSVSLGGSFTATNMLDAIKTVDGTGSGLDADLLDGQSSAYFRINVYDAAGNLLN